jgi:hypothetical protein
MCVGVSVCFEKMYIKKGENKPYTIDQCQISIKFIFIHRIGYHLYLFYPSQQLHGPCEHHSLLAITTAQLRRLDCCLVLAAIATCYCCNLTPVRRVLLLQPVEIVD